jgi:hypothetical protein
LYVHVPWPALSLRDILCSPKFPFSITLYLSAPQGYILLCISFFQLLFNSLYNTSNFF